jgi:hypothetical protein
MIFSVLIGGLVFYFLKKKISNVENKVNLMFQLIQEHEKKEQLRNNMQNPIMQQNVHHPVSQNSATNNNNDLIDVSEDDDDEENDDDESYDENDDNDENSMEANMANELLNTIKNLTMAGGTNLQHNESDDDEYDDDDSEDDDDDDDSDKLNIEGSLQSSEKNKIINLDVENTSSLDDIISLKEIKKVTTSNNQNTNINVEEIKTLNTNNIESANIMVDNNSDNQNGNDDNENGNDDNENGNDDNQDGQDDILDSIALSDDEKNTLPEEVKNEIKNSTKGIVNNDNTKFKNLTVSELKQECEKRNLAGFKSLKKTALIKLLEESA